MERDTNGKPVFQGWPLIPALWIGGDVLNPETSPKWAPILGEQGHAFIITGLHPDRKDGRPAVHVGFMRQGETEPVEANLSDVLFLPEDCEGHYAMEVRVFNHAIEVEPAIRSSQLASSFYQARVCAGLGAMFHATMGAERVEWSVYRYQGDERIEVEKGTARFHVEGPYKGHQDD